LTYRELHNLQRPWQSFGGEIRGLPTEQVEDIRRNEAELVRNGGSEFSIGAGLEAPWTARRAAAHRRYTEVDEPGGRYHRTTPPPGTFWPRHHRPSGHGSAQLHRFLRQNG
jgi:hypothetical protein